MVEGNPVRVLQPKISVFTVGVLCIQGAFIEHKRMLEKVDDELKDSCHLELVDVRKPEHLEGLDGLIIPGGESTTLSVFLRLDDFEGALRDWMFGGVGGRVVWGTCAGMILLANELKEQRRTGQITLGGLDIECSRNAYGRQLASFESPVTLHCKSLLTSGDLREQCHGIFIRAPGISKLNSAEVEVLATLEPGGQAVAVEQGNLMATSFHPELTSDCRWHSYFVRKIIQQKKDHPNL